MAIMGLPEDEFFACGHRACAGCGAATAVRLITKAAGKNSILVESTGCIEVVSTPYPETSWKIPWIHGAFENPASIASGISAALKTKGLEDKVNVIALGGDGSTYDIGLQFISGAFERGHDFTYVCLSPETELILSDGSIVEIGELIDQHIEKSMLIEVIRSNSNKLSASSLISRLGDVESVSMTEKTLSWNGKSFSPMTTLRAQRKESPEELIKVTTSSGSVISLTPEHRVIVDSIVGFEWKEAKNLNPGDEVYAPRKIYIDVDNEPYIIDFLDEDINLILPEKTKEKIKSRLREKYGTIKNASIKIGFKYWQFKGGGRNITLSGLKKICQDGCAEWIELRDKIREFSVRGGNNIRFKSVRFDEDLMYLLGLIASDGYLDKRGSIVFINKESQLLSEFKERYSKLFCGRKLSKVDVGGTYYVHVNNPALYMVAKNLKIKSDPKEIIKLPEPLISAFLRGFFDGDGHCSILHHKHTNEARIILTTTHNVLAKRLRLMLQRLGIASFQDSRAHRSDIIVLSREDIQGFIDKVGSNHPKKIIEMKRVRNLFDKQNPRGKYFSLAPRVCGVILREICKKHNIPITRVDRKRDICTLAAGKRRATKRRIREYIDKLKEFVPDDPLFEELELLLKEDFYLDPIKKIERVHCKSKYVYDITVPETHVFVPEGAFVISNCYDNEAYMNTGIQRSGATPYGASTTTSPSGKLSIGKLEWKKDILHILAAHGSPYVASASIGYPIDAFRKIRKAIETKGPTFINILCPCPTGWRFSSEKTIKIAKLAVETGVAPLYEIINGKHSINRPRDIDKLKPVEEYLKLQGRYKHLFRPEKKEKDIDFIQSRIKENLKLLMEMAEKGF